MIFSTTQNSINKMLKKFYQPKSYLLTSMSDQLQKILRWIGNYKSDQRAQVGRMINEIQRLLVKNKTSMKNKTNPYWLVVFKSMLLVHELLVIGIMGNVFEDILEVINQSLSHINQLNRSEITSVSNQLTRKPTSFNLLQQQKQALFQQQIIYLKFLKPYYNYLSRRCQLLPKGFPKKDKCYYLINLIGSACSCNEVIYMFGRYNKLDEFFIMGDFNLVLAKDIYLLYGLMKECIDFGGEIDNTNQQSMKTMRKNNETAILNNNSNVSVNQNKNKIDKNKIEKLNISQVDDILLQTHQKLYHIFYNKYNYKKTQHYLPDWINLDQYQNKSNSHLLIKNNKNLNMQLNLNHYNNDKNNRSFFINNKSKFYDEDQHLALDETASSIIGEKQQQNCKLNYSHLSFTNKNNNNISNEFVQQSLEIIHDLQEFLEKFDQNV